MKLYLTKTTLKGLAFAAFMIAGVTQGIAGTNAYLIQRRGVARGGGGGGIRMPAQTARGGGGGGFRIPTQTFHARRDVVRTQNYVTPARTGEYRAAGPTRQTSPTRQTIPARQSTPTRLTGQVGDISPRTGAVIQNSFTGTNQGRTYDNGLPLRKGVATGHTWRSRYFRSGYSYFPYYSNGNSYGNNLDSPYGSFYGLSVPYITSSAGQWYPPTVNFVDMPTYSGNTFTGFAYAHQGNLINDSNTYAKEPGLDAALNELVETYQGRNIDGLATLLDPNVSIAIYTSGHYRYSMAANNLVDLTRDALQTDRGRSFTLQSLHQRGPGVFSTSGENDYTDAKGSIHSVYMSFVLQDIGGEWTLTQMGTAPGVLHRG